MRTFPLRRNAPRGSRLFTAACILTLAALLGLKAAGLADAAGLNFQVNSTADALDASVGDGLCRTSSGACTLRAAIQEANAMPGPDVVHVPGGTYELAIPPLNQNDVTTGDLDITDSLEIQGAGAGSTFVDGGAPKAGSPVEARGLDRIFEVLVDGGEVGFSALTLRDGYAAEYGGAIMNNSTATVTVTAAELTGNVAGKTGGAIDNHVGGALAVSDSTLAGNYAGESGSAINNNRGGALTVADSSVSGNSAAAVGLDETLRGAGAIANNAELDARGTIAVTDSQISGNHAGGGRNGAGISNDGGGFLVVHGTSFSKNISTSDGGAIFNGTGEMTVTDSSFSENSANNGAGISSGGTLTVLDSVFTKNAGLDWGGGVHNFNLGGVSIRSSSFRENSALSGGGFANEGSGLVTVESSTFTKNIAVVSAVLDSGDGGGMHSNSGGEVHVSDVVFTENMARSGGGFSNGGGGIVRISASQLSGNVAEERGGGILVEGGDVRMLDIDVVGNTSKSVGEGGGGISYAGDKSASLGESAAIERSRIRDNKTAGEGGGIDSRGDGPLAIVETTIASNTAVIGGGLHHVGDAPLLVSRSTVSRNLSDHGGGVFVDGDGEATVENSTVSGNRAGQFGGGLLVSSRVAVRSSTVAENNAPSGGGINNGGGDLVGDGSVLLRNAIVANNPTGGNCAGTITSLGGNLENGNTCQLGLESDQPVTSPLLGVLADNGGPTQTHALLAGSPAQEAAVCTELEACPALDQRGVARPQFARHDIGAFESELPPGGDSSPPPPGECPKFANSVPAAADSWITQGSPSSNSGTDSSLKVKSQSGSNSRALVRFALPPLPEGCTTIASAVLRLTAASAKEGRTLAALEAAGPWTESGVTWNNQPATTGPAATTPSVQGTLEWDVTAQALGSYVSGNHGYVIRDLAEDGPGDEQSLSSREKPTDGPPELVLVFDDSTPETAIDARPDSPTDRTVAAFEFSSDRGDSTFQCSLDGAAFQACSSPLALEELAEGNHTFEVRATRRIRAVDPTPARHEWTIAIPPETFVAGPDSPNASADASLAFSADDPEATFECSLNGAAFAECNPPAEYSGLGDGRQEFRVRAVDPLGNADPSPAVHAWTVAVPPETSIDSGPADPSGSSTAAFAFSGTDNGTAPSQLAFECSLDGGSFAGCSNPASYEALAEGEHSFEVRAVDRAGNVDASPAGFSWRVDLTAPETKIDAGPADPSNSSAAEFGFSADEAGTFVCSLDGGPFVDCSSPRRYDGLGDGAHSFEVRGIDRAGNIDATAAAFGWVIDLIPPETEIDSGPVDPTNSTSAELTFSAGEAAIFECRLDGGDFAACSSPATYEGLAEGGHAVDVRAIDPAGNVDPSPARFSWTVDLTPPETTIDAQPPDPTTATSASIAFSADETASFECRLDDAPLTACSSPASYEGLREGRHTFLVRATDRAGNVEAGGATAEWTIDVTPPQTRIDSGPPDPSNSSSAVFEFSADEEATFSCSLDDAPFAACSSRYDGLAEGAHSLAVRATDRAGNVDGSPAVHSWTIDLTPPDTRIDSGPTDRTANTSASFAFSADEVASFECRLDGGAYASCTSPQTYERLGEGTRAFDVRAIDRAGNVDPSAARYSWTIDLTAPETEIDSGPADPTNLSAAAFSFSADEVADFECSLDGAPFTACASERRYESLAEGRHTFAVRATDLVGNVDQTPAAHEWTVDQSAPDTTIQSRPRDPTNETSATFTFVSGETDSTFECSLDGAPFASCASPAGYGGLAAGEHTFSVRATDRAGNTDSSPAAASWTIDLTPPETRVVSGPRDPSASSSAEFVFSADEAASFECRLDGGSFAGCVSPATYEGLGEGMHAFDVRAVDAAGNADASPSRSSWTIDLTAPQATIDSGPADPTNSTSADFAFSANEDGSTFECSLDGAAFSPCSSPASYQGLSAGPHAFSVVAIDRAGNVDPTPASHAWVVDTTAPETTISERPADPSNSGTASFAFSADEAAQFECRLDGGGYSACFSPQVYVGLSDGSHTFEVRAIDRAGNADPSPAAHSWTIDQTAPQTTIDTGPPATTTSTSATFTFSASEDGSTFECALDGEAFAGCTSPRTYDALAAGGHELKVRATDAAANTDASPAVHTWTIEAIDTIDPETTIDSGPPALTSSTGATFFFSSSEPGSTFECSLDGAAFAGCASPRQYTGLADGGHQFRVRARDSAGNLDPTPAAHSWTIDTVAPATTISSPPPALTSSSSASFHFSSNESGVTFECSLDSAAFAGCTSPRQYTGLADGSHQFRVQARDGAGNVDATPATHSWTIDTIVPETTITEAPPATTTSTSASFRFSASEAGSTFECSLDGAAFAACVSPRQYAGLAVGSHQFRVRARDGAGNLDGTPATHSWTITAPAGCPAPATLGALADAWIDENSASSNKGGDSILKIQSKGPRDNFRALVRFPLPVVPSGCRIDTVTLRLFAASMKPGRTLHALRLGGPWAENAVSWANQPPTAGTAAAALSGFGYREWDVTSHLQAMLDGAPNHGFLIRDAVESQDAEQQFHSREKGESQPQLVVRFTGV